MSSQGRCLEDREAASIVAGLHFSSSSSSSPGSAAAGTSASTSRASKKRARDHAGDAPRAAKKPAAARPEDPPAETEPLDATARVFLNPRLAPSPYFYYTDHSHQEDDDPLKPITAAGSVPTFPAKMHAILTNPALAGAVEWAPHGRSWRILKPRHFEINILPKYFEHSKFSSFVRQANGWGFRRMSQGNDKNAYYHEYFLRSMPWLCKQMRRPKVSEKKAVDPATEPGLAAISRERPVRDEPPTREVLVLRKTIERGPRARMPVLWDTGTPPAAPSSPALAPARARALSDGDLKPAARPAPAPQVVGAPRGGGAPVAAKAALPGNHGAPASFDRAAAAATTPSQGAPPGPPGPPGGPATHPFAAGFMAATAYHSDKMRSMLGNAFVAGVNNGNTAMPLAGMNQGNRAMPPAVASAAAGARPTAAELAAFGLLQRAGRGRSNAYPPGSAAFAARGPHGHPDIAALRAAAANAGTLYGPGAATDARGLEMLGDARFRPRGYSDVPAAALGANADVRGLYGPGVATAPRPGIDARGLEMWPPGSLSNTRVRPRGYSDAAAALGANAGALYGPGVATAALGANSGALYGPGVASAGSLSNETLLVRLQRLRAYQAQFE